MPRRASAAVSLTDGSLFRNILLFSVPLIFSQLLQVLFNMADVAVVGKFSSAEALGAVGSTTILVSLFTGFIIGMGSAVNVRVAQHLGAGNKEKTASSIRTSFVICLITGCLITVLCLVCARFMLELLRTKEDLIDGVWYSMPVSDFSAAVIAGVVMMRYMNKLKKMHKENEKLRSQGVKEVKELRS